MTASPDLLSAVLSPGPGPFALLCRSGTQERKVEVLRGPIREVASLDDVEDGAADLDRLVVIPFRQVAERGFDCVDDGTPLVVMDVAERSELDVDEVVRRIPDVDLRITEDGFDRSDEDYADAVRQIIDHEIGAGEGANFVFKRTYQATLHELTPAHTAMLFKRLLQREPGAWWIFAVHTGERTLIGATPERHLVLADGRLTMNPISGTYRYPESGPTLEELLGFLRDDKESEELFMVVDEELKMMAHLCESDVRIVGPRLREMSRLAHTEYVIEGFTSRPVGELLRATMFAPTVVGSPLESACRVVERYEPEGRGYYAGILALIEPDGQGGESLDSVILIRCADIDADGAIGISVGATIVRQSDPASEAKETEAKALGVLDALRTEEPAVYGEHPEVTRLLALRNNGVAPFWHGGFVGEAKRGPTLSHCRALVIDAEDNFTFMLEHQLSALGLGVSVRAHDEGFDTDDYDVVVMGPGPGDPCDRHDPRIARLHELTASLLAEKRPLLSICLSHQVLCSRLGLPIVRRATPNQGVRKTIELFGEVATVGFYNAFSARCAVSMIDGPDGIGPVQVGRDPVTDEVHALRGRSIRSFQFHPESVLSTDGLEILLSELESLLGAPNPAAPRRYPAA